MTIAADLVTQREVDQRFAALDRLLSERKEAQQTAIALQAATLNERLTHSNGLIGQMAQQAQDFARHESLNSALARLEKLEQWQSSVAGTERGRQPMMLIGMSVLTMLVGAAVTALFLGGDGSEKTVPVGIVQEVEK